MLSACWWSPSIKLGSNAESYVKTLTSPVLFPVKVKPWCNVSLGTRIFQHYFERKIISRVIYTGAYGAGQKKCQRYNARKLHWDMFYQYISLIPPIFVTIFCGWMQGICLSEIPGFKLKLPFSLFPDDASKTRHSPNFYSKNSLGVALACKEAIMGAPWDPREGSEWFRLMV